MFRNIYPLFERKHLLKKEMLDNLRDYPREIFNMLYQDYSDGILSGCRLEVREGKLILCPGMLCYRKIPYLLTEKYEISCRADGRLRYLKVRFYDKTVGADGEEYLSNILLEEEAAEEGYEMELARFTLQHGARLRTDYVDFYDFETAYDTVNLIHAPYASPGRSSISPQITDAFMEALLKLSPHNSWDQALCMGSMGQGTIPAEKLRAYLNVRLEQEKNRYTNEEAYSALKRILRQAAGGVAEDEERQGERKLMLF